MPGIADSTYEGFQRIVDELPVDGQYIELPTDPSAYAATLLDACDQEPAMIFTSANNGMIDEVVSAAPNYPDIKFMVLDTALSQDGIDKLDNFGGRSLRPERSFLPHRLSGYADEQDRQGRHCGRR